MVGLQGTSYVDLVRMGSMGTSLGTGFSGRQGVSLELVKGNGGSLEPLERLFVLVLRNEVVGIPLSTIWVAVDVGGVGPGLVGTGLSATTRLCGLETGSTGAGV